MITIFLLHRNMLKSKVDIRTHRHKIAKKTIAILLLRKWLCSRRFYHSVSNVKLLRVRQSIIFIFNVCMRRTHIQNIIAIFNGEHKNQSWHFLSLYSSIRAMCDEEKKHRCNVRCIYGSVNNDSCYTVRYCYCYTRHVMDISVYRMCLVMLYVTIRQPEALENYRSEWKGANGRAPDLSQTAEKTIDLKTNQPNYKSPLPHTRKWNAATRKKKPKENFSSYLCV